MLGVHAKDVAELAPRYAKCMSRIIKLFTCIPPEINSYTQLKKLQEAVDASDPIKDMDLISEDEQCLRGNPQKPISSTVYLCSESGVRWRQHVHRTPQHMLAEERVKRRMAKRLLEAKYRRLCLHCWFPLDCCICGDFILKYRNDVFPTMNHDAEECKSISQMSCDNGRVKVHVTFILHPEEFMRQSNTAHVTAMTMNSEVLFSGFANDNTTIASIGINQDIQVSRVRCNITPILSEEERRKRRNRVLKDKRIRRAKEKEIENLSALHDGNSEKDITQTHDPLLSHLEHTDIDTATESSSVDLLKSQMSEKNECTLRIERLHASTLDILLYPEVGGSVTVNNVVAALRSYQLEESTTVNTPYVSGVPYFTDQTPEEGNPENRLNTGGGIIANASSSTSVAVTNIPVVDTIHVYLSDGTWSQARVVNRRISRNVPRVSLHISPEYHGLFHALRKKTRGDGVSTLEATTIVVGQLLRCANVDVDTALSNKILRLEASMRNLMLKFVDIAALHSTILAYKCVGLTSEETNQVILKRNQYRTDVQIWEEKGRAEFLAESIDVSSLPKTTEHQLPLKTDVIETKNDYQLEVSSGKDINWALVTQDLQTDRMRHLFPAPVTCYCYVCDNFVGFGNRMIQHVTGFRHLNQLKQTGNYMFQPSELSRTHQNFKTRENDKHESN